jgi:hypothetical protein
MASIRCWINSDDQKVLQTLVTALTAEKVVERFRYLLAKLQVLIVSASPFSHLF